MRPLVFAVAAGVMAAAVAPACALQASDTIQAWANASAKERADFLKQTIPSEAIRDKVSRCITDASGISGHAGLPIGEVAKACATAGDQPV